MGHHCCSKQKVKRGLWSPEEDEKLMRYITTHGHACWSSVPKQAGLQRCGKSCRLRWINYLRPDLKRGSFSSQEERVIIDVHRILGNRWAQIAKHLPGRTDNEVKNFWNSCIKKKLIAQGLDPKTHNLLSSSHNKGHASNVSQFHHQSTTTPFTINSHMKVGETMREASVQMNLPFITLPPPAPPPPTLDDPVSVPTSFQYEDINTSNTTTSLLWNTKEQSLHVSMDLTSTSSLENTPISSSFNGALGFGYTDENCLWIGDAERTLEAQAIVNPQQQHQQQQHHHHLKLCEMDFDESNGEKGHEMETTYNRPNFDLEFMESTLTPCALYGNAGSMEQFAWDDC